MLGLTMGVATLITVMTIVQGANVYVEQKIANLGTNVFQIARTPFAVTDFNIIIKALKYKKIEMEEVRAVAGGCPACEVVGATASTTARARYGNKEVPDVSFSGRRRTWRILATARSNSVDISLSRKLNIGPAF